MPRGFGATQGSGSTDSVDMALYADITGLSAFTFAAWVNYRALGGGSQGRIIAVGDNGTASDWQVQVASISAANRFAFNAGRWTTTDGQWRIDAGSLANTWQHLAVTYSFSSTSNAPSMYVGAVAQTVTTVTAPSGTATGTVTGNVYIGNVQGGIRNYDGRLADVAIWNRILTVSELRTVRFFGPHRVRSGLVFSVPLIGASPEPNYARPGAASSATVTGTAVATDIVRPSAYWPTYGFAATPNDDGAATPSGTGKRSFVAGMIG